MSIDLPKERDIQDEIRKFVLENFLPGEAPDKLALDHPLISAGLVDSAGLVVLLTFLEDLYGVTFAVEEIARESAESVAEIAAAVHRKIKEKH